MICGPIYTIADIFEDPQFRARDMLLPHHDPEFGEYIGPGIVPKFSETPGAGALVGDLGGGQSQPRRLRRPARALRRRARRAEGGGRPVTGHDLRRRAARRAPERGEAPRARRRAPSSSDRLAAAGVPRIEAVSFVNPARVPQMAGAEEVVAGIDRRDGRRLRGARAERARLRPAARDRARRGALRLRRHRDASTAATRTRRRRSRLEAANDDRRARTRGRDPRDGDDRRLVRLPVRRRGRPGARRSASPSSSPAPARTRSSSPTRSASASRAR